MQRSVAGQAPSPLPSGQPQPRDPAPWEGARGWKGLVALLALGLSGLIWFSGLQESLQRPSVVDALDIRQLELGVLAADALPPPMRPFLVGDDPRGELIDVLEKRSRDGASPPLAAQRLELALLRRSRSGQRGEAGDSTLAALTAQVDAPRRPLLQALQQASPVTPEQREALLAPWGDRSLVAQLGCEELGGTPLSCPAGRAGSALVLRLLALSLFPGVLMVAGAVLLGRQLWLLKRGRLPEPPPLVGPPLSLVDVALVIAGGFVLLGEVLLPALTQGPVLGLLSSLDLTGSTRQAVAVLGSYLTLMAAPLALLALLLPRDAGAPQGGWLQWGWRPAGAVVGPALRVLLMVMPMVALASWLLQLVWADPGGSNPLLEMVLTNSDPWALLSLAITAVVLAPLFEETLFRGLLLPVLGRQMGAMGGVVISALLFALAHLSVGELVPLSVLGIGLGLLRWRSGRLAACVCLHGLWNSLTFLNLLLLAS